MCITWNDGDLCTIENDAAHPNPVKCSKKEAADYMEYLQKTKIIKPKESVFKRAIILLGLYGLSMLLIILAIHGAICFLKKVGWLLW